LLPIVHWATHNQTLYIRCPEQLHEKSVHREVSRLQYSERSRYDHCIEATFILNKDRRHRQSDRQTSTHIANWQDAQLSQRGRAAGCVIVLSKSGIMELLDKKLEGVTLHQSFLHG